MLRLAGVVTLSLFLSASVCVLLSTIYCCLSLCRVFCSYWRLLRLVLLVTAGDFVGILLLFRFYLFCLNFNSLFNFLFWHFGLGKVKGLLVIGSRVCYYLWGDTVSLKFRQFNVMPLGYACVRVSHFCVPV